MAPPLRSTLPKNFAELLIEADEATLLAVFERHRVDATGGYGKRTALSFPDCPEGLVRWLVDNGADIGATDLYGNTPLHAHARAWNGQPGLLLELGADIEALNKDAATALHAAADGQRVEHVRVLVAGGADVAALDQRGLTPAARMLARCQNATIAEAAEILEFLIESGAIVTAEMRAEAARIGADFEFHRQNFNRERLPAADAGLKKIYALLDAPPVPARRMHDGTSKIAVAQSRWQDQHDELWELLVPSNGAAATAQGEVIRITGRISDEIERNGGVNWDRDYRLMADALCDIFASGSPLPAADLTAAKKSVQHLRGRNKAETNLAGLSELAVRWVLANPDPLPLGATRYAR